MQAALIYASGGKSKAAALLEAGYSRSTAMHCADRTFAAINRNLDGASALADDRLGVGPITGGKWKNHGQFVRSVGDTATRFQKAGLITGAQRGQSSRRQLDLGVESKAP